MTSTNSTPLTSLTPYACEACGDGRPGIHLRCSNFFGGDLCPECYDDYRKMAAVASRENEDEDDFYG